MTGCRDRGRSWDESPSLENAANPANAGLALVGSIVTDTRGFAVQAGVGQQQIWLTSDGGRDWTPVTVPSVWPSAVLLGVITAALGLAGVVLREKERMLSELTSRYAQDRILDVTCAVDLAAFDQPEFHDRVARAQAGVFRAPQMVFGLQGLGRSMAGAIGAADVLPRRAAGDPGRADGRAGRQGRARAHMSSP